MNYFLILPFVSFIVNSLLGVYIVYKKPRSKAGLIYIFVIWLSALWSLFHFLTFCAANLQTALILNRFSVILAAFDAAVFLRFTFNYAGKKWTHQRLPILIYLPAVVLSILSVTTNLISNGAFKAYWGYWISRGPAYIFHSLYIFGYGLTGIMIALLSKNTIAQKHRWTIFIGYLIPLTGGLITEIIAPLANIRVVPLAPELMTVSVAVIVYGMLRCDFLEITPAMATEVIIEMIPDDVIILNKDQEVSFMNQMASEDFNYTAENAGRADVKTLFSNELDLITILDQIQENGTVQNYEAKITVRNGGKAIVSVNGSLIKDNFGRTAGYVLAIRDITHHIKTEEQIKYLAYHDPLTGLENRKAFYEYVERLIVQAQRPQKTNVRALLYIDMDNFKRVNDIAGHDAGDLFLQEMAQRIRDNIRRSDTVFRIGGDEFTVLLHTITNEIDAGLVAAKLIENIVKPFSIKEHHFKPSASIGISIYPRDGMDVQTLMKNADEAMYEAKRERGRYCFYNSEMSSLSNKRLQILDGIRTAIAMNQLVNQYQPIVDENSRIIGIEALVRWQHPERGMILPDEFIAVAENSRLMREIDEWVLDTACADLEALSGESKNIKLFVNFSAAHFNEPGFVESVLQILKGHHFEPERLIIEITEDSVIANDEESKKSLDVLIASGIRIAIDNFGTKCSVLSYILNYPLAYLKIDRSFLQEMPGSQRRIALMEGLFNMTQPLDIQVIAEGVESQTQHQLLTGIGCRYMQGYLYSKPVSMSKLREMMEDN